MSGPKVEDRTTFEADGTLDEVFRNQASVHLERLNAGQYWLRVDDRKFVIGSKSGRAVIGIREVED